MPEAAQGQALQGRIQGAMHTARDVNQKIVKLAMQGQEDEAFQLLQKSGNGAMEQWGKLMGGYKGRA